MVGKTDISTVLNQLHSLRQTFPEAASRVALELGGNATAKAKGGIAPRDKNNLVSTIRVERIGNEVFFLAGGQDGEGSPSVYVDYAGYVNNGTAFQIPQFFMERSIAAAIQDKESYAIEALNSWLRLAMES